jgi:hypothetical protein
VIAERGTLEVGERRLEKACCQQSLAQVHPVCCDRLISFLLRRTYEPLARKPIPSPDDPTVPLAQTILARTRSFADIRHAEF